ncbi:Uncharacterised protein [Chlamydia trachomatis]|nr:Uncharacterised protein [Chlamydia trachomatis]
MSTADKKTSITIFSLWICTVITGILLELPLYSHLISFAILTLSGVIISHIVKKNNDEATTRKNIFRISGLCAAVLAAIALLFFLPQ